MKRVKFRWWYTLILIPLLIIFGFLVWASTPLGPMPEAIAALESSVDVDVSQERWITFTPMGNAPEVGIIIYPGGRVDPRSYAPTAHAIARQGHLVVIVPMPLNLAVFGVNKAEDVITSFPNIQNWVVGGHSLGGSMAANYTNNNFESIDGLYLWASYPADSDDLSDKFIPVISISASRDGLITQQDVEDSRKLLPESTTWAVIQGGNHAQFGWYGEQRGDNPAMISREEQQAEVVERMLQFIEGLW